MPRQLHRLSARTIQTESKVGYHADGGGLYLQISKFGTKSWVFRYTFHRKREMGLGSVNDVSLKEARDISSTYRAMVRDGIDPINERKQKRAQSKADSTKLTSFKECAEDYIRHNSAAWSNAKHSNQWKNTLETYAYPVIGSLPVAMVELHHITRILKPIWAEKNETAKRVRGRIEAVLDAAKVNGLREGENPARWKGHLDKILPMPSKVKKVKHHAALPYEQIDTFMQDLRERDSIAASGLEFLILTAARTGEVLKATFDEIDFEKKMWVIPENRMKAGKEHRVPLSNKAMKIIKAMKDMQQSDFIFAGFRGNCGLSNMAFLQLLKRMGYKEITTHGFRSSFRDWAAEQTAYPPDVVEMALAHSVGNETTQAYHRTDLFEKRRRLMNEWSNYCDQVKIKGEVVNIKEVR